MTAPMSSPVVAVNDDVSASGTPQPGRDESGVDGGEPELAIHCPATLHVWRDGTLLCSVVGCCRPSGLTAQFADGTTAMVCCELCIGGESHTEECEACSSLWRRRQQRLLRRQQESASAEGAKTAAASSTSVTSKSAAVPIAELESDAFGDVRQVRNGVDEAIRGLELLQFAATGAQPDSTGASRTISAEIKSAAEEEIARLECFKGSISACKLAL